MELIKWSKKQSSSGPGFMLRVSPDEALALIQSLSGQLAAKNPNVNRAEHYTEKGEYFSIAVHEKIKTPREEELEIDHIYKRIKNAANQERYWPGMELPLP